MTPFFSIIIPVYNVAPYLRECLDSVLAQTFTDWEAICVDDGSTDGSGAILDEYAAKDKRFRVIHQKNAGVSAARNKGIALSHGKYISFLDSDDVIVPKWLATATTAINETGADIVRLWLTYWDGSKPMPAIDYNNTYSIYEGGESIISWGWRVLLREGWSWLLFLKRELLATQGGLYPLQIGLREDNIFLLRQIKNFSKVCQVGYAGYLYRQRQNSSINRVHSNEEARRFSHELKNLWPRDRKIVRKSRQGLMIESMVRECIRDPFGACRPNIVVRAARKLLRMIWPSRNNRCRSVCFITPGPSAVPVGGYKVVYEYANRLVGDGWYVTIVFPLTLFPKSIVVTLLRHPRSTIKVLISSLMKTRRQKREMAVGQFWLPLDRRIKCIYPWRIVDRFVEWLPKNTHFVSTYVTTAEALLQVRVSNRYQLIQDREDWFGVSLNELYETYRYPMTKIVISKWLGDCVKEAGGECVCIPNGLDFDYFMLNKPIAKRNRYEVAFLWHVDERKRTKDTTDALQKVKEKHPELHVTAFGVSMAPANLPEWITYIQKPDRECHNKIYNDAAIFVASSEQEGWGLTPCEAMQCGAAVACTDIGGYKMFAKDQETALLSPARDPEALADNICRLIEDDAMRIRIAEAGHRNIQQFTWDRSVALFESVLEGNHGR